MDTDDRSLSTEPGAPHTTAAPVSASKLASQPAATWLTWLKLMRLPTVFTALSNILCGYLLTHVLTVQQLPQQASLFLLLLASAGLYLSGMVLNDVCDATLDARERPERPIPSGRISLRAALLLGCLLMAGGLAAAALVGSGSLSIAVLLAVAIVTYNVALKSTRGGALGMGLCRFLNLLLGASAAGSATAAWQQPQLGFATGLLVYVAGVTWFARHEAGDSPAGSLWAGLLLLLCGIAVDAALLFAQPFPPTARTGAAIALGLIAGNLLLRGAVAIRDGSPRRIQQTVGLQLLSIIFLDATVVFARTGDASLAALVICLVVPATLMKRVIPLS